MSGLVNGLAIAAVVVLVVVRQFRAQQIGTGRRWWLLPAILAVVALREPGIVDAHHRVESIALLGTELLIGLATGAAWAWTTRIWAEPDGTVWSKSTKASVTVWIVGIALRGRPLRSGRRHRRAPGQLRPAHRPRGHPPGPLRHPGLAGPVDRSRGGCDHGVR